MFTGIIETMGTVLHVEKKGSNRSYTVRSPLSTSLKIDQSVSHSGVCLTVESVDGDTHRVTAIEETLEKTNLAEWEAGTEVNIERCLAMNGRLDGHFVQGHVDCRARCEEVADRNGSWEYRFEFPEQFASLVIEKGSICVNGISLTAFRVDRQSFTVAIIPYTYDHTNLKQVKTGSQVNIEFDMIGKYILRKISLDPPVKNG